jgi:SAM-dependent methyltransferase
MERISPYLLFSKLPTWLVSKNSTIRQEIFNKYWYPFLCDLHGVVVEIGAGECDSYLHAPNDIEWIIVEPNANYHKANMRKKYRKGIELLCHPAENLPIPDCSVDTVIAKWVLCSVSSQKDVLKEVYRVLKIGGQFLFLEHVAAEGGSLLNTLQHIAKPIWQTLAGCDPTRNTAETIEKLGFNKVEYESFFIRKGFPVEWPHIRGRAIR